MKTNGPWFVFSVIITSLFNLTLRATTYYVDAASPNPVPPYTSWATAATNIQDAVSLAQAGDCVLVNSGIYEFGGAMVYGSSNRVALTNPITLTGINGPQNTAIVGGMQTRCIYVGTNAFLNGFSLVDGTAVTSGNEILNECGGGAWCEASGVISNCVFGGNYFPYADGSTLSDDCTAEYFGGADYGGTIYDSVLASNSTSTGFGESADEANLINCIITNNGTSPFEGNVVEDGVISNCTIINNFGNGAYESVLYNCNVISNSASGTFGCTNYQCLLLGNSLGGARDGVSYGCIIASNIADSALSGGGANYGTLYNCVLIGNTTPNGSYSSGGGAAYCSLYRCLLISNSAPTALYGGGGAYECTLFNCLLAGNSIGGEVGGGGASYSTLYNCTVVNNNTGNGGRSLTFGGGVTQCTLYNSIIYDNSMLNTNYMPINSNYSLNNSFTYCDTTPLVSGPGNITNDPAFVNPAIGNYQLQSDSPCINSGDNFYVTTTNDLAGNPRISGGTVDMGAYEYQNPSSILSYAWAQQYGLPTDGSMDYSDLDGTGMPNWEKSIAELDPTNSTSVLAVAPPMATNNTSGITITWQSVQYLHYMLQRSSDLSQPFATIQSNLVGQAGTSSYTDITATNSVPYFYRIGIQ